MWRLGLQALFSVELWLESRPNERGKLPFAVGEKGLSSTAIQRRRASVAAVVVQLVWS